MEGPKKQGPKGRPRMKESDVLIENGAEIKRLDFFRRFLAAIGKDRNAVAEAAGVTSVMVSHWWKTDDARLDQLMAIAERFGYRLEVYLTRGETIPEKPVELDAKDFDNNGERFTLKRMAFLSFALRECGMTKSALATKLGISVWSVNAWYKADNITIGRIYDIAKVCGYNIFFTIAQPQQPYRAPQDAIRVSYRLSINGEADCPLT